MVLTPLFFTYDEVMKEMYSKILTIQISDSGKIFSCIIQMMKTILDTVDFLDGIIFIYHQALLDIMSTSTENHFHPCKCKLLNLYNNNNFLYNQHLAWHRQKVSLLLCLLIARNSDLFAEAIAGNSLDIDKMIIADSAYPLNYNLCIWQGVDDFIDQMTYDILTTTHLNIFWNDPDSTNMIGHFD